MIGNLDAARAKVEAQNVGSAEKKAAIIAYNAQQGKCLAKRSDLVIQREAAGMVAGGSASVMRVDVIRDSMGGGTGVSAGDAVREEYPIPQRLDREGRPTNMRIAEPGWQ
jgi:hypothetical protein